MVVALEGMLRVQGLSSPFNCLIAGLCVAACGGRDIYLNNSLTILLQKKNRTSAYHMLCSSTDVALSLWCKK